MDNESTQSSLFSAPRGANKVCLPNSGTSLCPQCGVTKNSLQPQRGIFMEGRYFMDDWLHYSLCLQKGLNTSVLLAGVCRTNLLWFGGGEGGWVARFCRRTIRKEKGNNSTHEAKNPERLWQIIRDVSTLFFWREGVFMKNIFILAYKNCSFPSQYPVPRFRVRPQCECWLFPSQLCHLGQVLLAYFLDYRMGKQTHTYYMLL